LHFFTSCCDWPGLRRGKFPQIAKIPKTSEPFGLRPAYYLMNAHMRGGKDMKLQVLNGSFGKVLAAATIAFMISLASPAQAQQGQWYSDGCFYAAAQNGQMVRQGCAATIGGAKFYYDFATKIITDLGTHYQFFIGQDGRALIYTTAGWKDLAAYVQAIQARSAGTAGGTCVPHTGPGSVGTGCSSPELRYPDITLLLNAFNQRGVNRWLESK
jgi:hypothetical protein